MTAKRGTGLSWVSILGIVCIALVLFTGILHVAHTHPNGHIDPDCSLCMTAHNAVQIVVAVTLVISARPVARYVAETFTPVPRQRFVLKLANRPPPVPAGFSA
ncbi:MAG TPA: hypothetical protein VHZ09_15140 [Acidobacteriaceae bacterium]|nr:hypothetical protein [Acidobacteriaceae bacterium]